MLAMEELLCELSDHEKRNEQGLPPGFRFHPTDEELITYYLASKVFNGSFTNIKFAEVDLNRCEPWELPDVAKMGEREWYLFSLRDRKYPTGLRTNRATGAGYWKATGKDKEVYSGTRNRTLLGMKKTLVFYKGRAPRGEKTKWVMHEYRLDGHFSLPLPCTSTVQNLCHVRRANQEEWVICRIFHKSGEKRTPILQVQGHSVSDASSSPTKITSFTTLELESQSQSSSHRDLQCPLPIHHHQDQNDISHIFPLHASSHPSFSDLLFKQQNCTLKTTKTEDTTFYQLLDDHNNLRWANKLNQNPSNSFLNTFPLDHDQVDPGFMAANANAQVRDMMSMSTSAPFNRVGLQQVLDPPDHIGIDSWPLPQHV